jgi:ABC-type uncharacterized transport system auxiliary subunit
LNALARRRELVGVAILAAVFLSACGGVPDTHYYTVNLPAAAPAADAQTPLVLDVTRFQAAEPLRDDRILYYQSPTELNYYEYHRWSAEPVQLMAALVAQRLRASGVFVDVRLFPHSAPGDYVLRGRLLDFEELDYEPGGHARVALELVLLRGRDQKIVWSDTARSESEIQGKGVAAVVNALNASANQVIDKLLPAALAQVQHDAEQRLQPAK